MVPYSILLILLMVLILFYYVNQEGFVDATRNCVSKETPEPTFLCQAKEYLSSFISGYNNTSNYKYIKGVTSSIAIYFYQFLEKSRHIR